jgi:hypothetical protein
MEHDHRPPSTIKPPFPKRRSLPESVALAEAQ